MSVPFPTYPRTQYTAPFTMGAPAWPAQPYPVLAQPMLTSQLSGLATGSTPSVRSTPTFVASRLANRTLPSLPASSSQYKALAKAVGFLIPAIILARLKPSAIVAQEILPSDWKIWAKMVLSMACLTEVHTALNWNPPPWLRAFMNVCMMTSLMPSLAGTRLKVILGVGSTVSALAQLSQYAYDKLKEPLQQKYNIPPWVTQLGLALANMGLGIVAMPKLLGLLFSSQRETSVLYTTCPNACCSSPFCINTAFNNVTLASENIKNQIEHHHYHPKDGHS